MNIFRKLEWKNTDKDNWIADSPSSRFQGRYLSIFFEEGKYWPVWDPSLPSYDTLEEAQKEGQIHHENFLKKYINDEYI